MVYLAGQASSLEDAREKLIEVMNNGKALESFKTFLSAQGGDASVVDDPSKLPQAQFKIEVEAKEDGYVSEIVADEIGTATMLLGAGRATKESEIDLAVGLMSQKVGDSVKQGESLVTIYANRENVEDVKAKIYENMKISKEHVDAPTLVHGIVTK